MTEEQKKGHEWFERERAERCKRVLENWERKKLERKKKK